MHINQLTPAEVSEVSGTSSLDWLAWYDRKNLAERLDLSFFGADPWRIAS